MGIALLKTMKSKLAFVILLILLATCLASTVDAKFWEKGHRHKHRTDQSSTDSTAQSDKPLSKKERKKLNKEQKKKEKKEQKAERKKQKQERKNSRKHKNTAIVEAGTASIEKVVHPEDEYPLTKMKDRYRVDVLAALYLDDLVKGESVTFKDKIPQKAEQGLAFYEGILIAADSLKKAGFNIDIYVHDIASAAEASTMLVAEDKLDSSDLIIGAVPAKDIAILAAYARKKQVNFVSASSSADGDVRNNVYFSFTQPSLKSHCQWIANNVAAKFPGMSKGIVILRRNSVPADEITYKYLVEPDAGSKYPAMDNSYAMHYPELLCNSLPGKGKLAAMFDTTKPNVVIIPILDAAYADSLLTELAHDFPSTHFEVYGMPTWSNMKDLRKEGAFQNVAVNLTTPFHVDLSSTQGKYVTGIYKRDYGTKAPDFVYRGYETMFWYANLLKNYGTIFNVKYEDNTAAPFTSFEMKPVLDKSGRILYYENKHLFLSKYEGGINKTE